MSYDKIESDISRKNFAPVYFLTGDEPYFIDQLAMKFEQGVLEPAEREFNQTVIFGSEINVFGLMEMAKRYPMFANYQVIIVKEAQDIKEIEELNAYMNHPVPTTILVICYKFKKLDKRRSLTKAIEQKGVFYESKKLYPGKIPDWISRYMQSKFYQLDPRAAALLAEHVGNDLSRLVHEADKLMLNLPVKSIVTVEHIDQFIGVSKEFNVFELQNAMGVRNIYKANEIAWYMAANPKENPLILVIPSLFSFFMKLLRYHTLTDKSKAAVASGLGVNIYFVSDYQKAASNFPVTKLVSIISLLRQYDLRSKGVNNDSTSDSELLKELVYKILH